VLTLIKAGEESIDIAGYVGSRGFAQGVDRELGEAEHQRGRVGVLAEHLYAGYVFSDHRAEHGDCGAELFVVVFERRPRNRCHVASTADLGSEQCVRKPRAARSISAFARRSLAIDPRRFVMAKSLFGAYVIDLRFAAVSR
jgi:hypothetical protein